MGIGIVIKGAEDFRDCGAIQAANVLDARQYVDIGIFARTNFGAENMGFSTTVWEWYGQDEYKRVLAVGEAIDALGLLALDAGAQQASIPDCAACEAWSMAMLPLEALLATCASALPDEVRAGVQNLWGQCNGLSEAAFHCGDRGIFEHEQWQLLREAAGQLLGVMEEAQLRPFLEELMVDCGRAVHGVKS